MTWLMDTWSGFSDSQPDCIQITSEARETCQCQVLPQAIKPYCVWWGLGTKVQVHSNVQSGSLKDPYPVGFYPLPEPAVTVRISLGASAL